MGDPLLMQCQKIGAVARQENTTPIGSHGQEGAVRSADSIRFSDGKHIMAPCPEQLDQAAGLAVFVKQKVQAVSPHR
jgi:hypothetical protein